MTKSKSRRKNYFIKKKFQASFFSKFAALLVFEAVLITVFFMYVSRGTLTAAYRGMDFTIEKTSSYFLVDFVVVSLIVGAAVAAMAVFVFMLISHRIGGALYHFEKALEEARHGNLGLRVRLRKTDELHDMNTQLNIFLETLDTQVSEIKQAMDTGIAAAHEIRDGANGPKVLGIMKNVKMLLDRFKTTK